MRKKKLKIFTDSHRFYIGDTKGFWRVACVNIEDARICCAALIQAASQGGMQSPKEGDTNEPQGN